MTDLQFDEETHTYWLAGRRLPSVTTITGPIMPNYGIADPTLGSRVHTLTEHHDNGTPHLITEDDALALMYLAHWRQFLEDYDAVWSAIEERIHNPAWGYAGTLDRRGRMVINGEPHAVIVDIKTGEPDRWHGVQLAGYAFALGTNTTDYRRFGVYLRPDHYKVIEYADPSDFVAFTALVTINSWKARG